MDFDSVINCFVKYDDVWKILVFGEVHWCLGENYVLENVDAWIW